MPKKRFSAEQMVCSASYWSVDVTGQGRAGSMPRKPAYRSKATIGGGRSTAGLRCVHLN